MDDVLEQARKGDDGADPVKFFIIQVLTLYLYCSCYRGPIGIVRSAPAAR